MDAQAEKALLLAIIIQCVNDMRGLIPGIHSGYKAAIQREAKQWLVSDRRDVGSFIWICDELNLSASWLRRKLLAWVENGEKVSTTRARRMEHGGRSQHEGVPLGIYYQKQHYGGR